MKTFIPNIEFDLSLSGNTRLRDWSHWKRHFLWAQSFEPSEKWNGLDASSIEREAYNAYCDYLFSLGLNPPSLLADGTPIFFGGRKSIPYSVLSKVNSKSFWAKDNEQRICNNFDEVVGFLQLCRLGTKDHPQSKVWMLKQSYGNGGWGNLRWSTSDSFPQEWLLDYFSQDDSNSQAIVIEPWRKRLEDWGSSFFITEQGVMKNIHHYQVLNTVRGGFLGIGLWPSVRMQEYTSQLERSAQEVGEKLFQAGYWGPAQVDHFLWKDEKGKEYLQTPVEVNARYSMYVVSYGVQQHFFKMPYVFWRLFHSKSFSTPYVKTEKADKENELGKEIWAKPYREWSGQIQSNEYNTKKQQGVLLTSPLRSQKNTSIGVAWLYSHLEDMVGSYRDIVGLGLGSASLKSQSSQSQFLKTKSVRDL